MMIPSPSELVLILLIVVMIFGAKRIPEIMGGLGKGIKSFKKAFEAEDTSAEALPPPPASPALPQPPVEHKSDNPGSSQQKIDQK